MTWLLETLVWTGVLIALVLVVRRPVARHFGPRTAYALWALPLLRLCLPPLVLPAAEPRFEATPVVDPQVLAALDSAELAEVPANLVSDPTPGWWEGLETGILALWLVGAATYIALRLVAYHQLRRDLLLDARSVGDAGRIRLVETPATRSPLAFGLFDKVVALPPGFMANPDRATRDLALAHELAHHRSHDLLANFAALPLFAIHWFNPLAQLGWNAMRRDQEAACDARVVEGRDRLERAHYAALIAGAAAAPRAALAAPMACPVLGEKSIIHRLRNLTMTDHSVRRRRIGGAFVGIAALALPLTASITYAHSSPTEAIEPPTAPDAPLPPEAPLSPEAPAAPDAPDAPEAVAKVHRVLVTRAAGDRTEGKRRVTVIRDGKAEDFEIDIEGQEGRRFMFRGADGKVFTPQSPEFKEHMAKLEERMAKLDKELEAKFKFDEKSLHAFTEEHRKAAERMARSGEKLARLAPLVEMSCEDGGDSRVVEGKDGRKVFRFCRRTVMHGAVSGLRSAREAIAANSRMSEETRREVLDKLDREIERLESEKRG
ncbi:Methicillin resistance mecR1 protein [Tsuneonella dongtanensis]|uniref:Methicillin resistance mecR1 protein n=1 Tax=Tsuneonella dongtanensis TaxID=692370 RepID=A0A1B2AE81_9SPHN|nr:M56 family metallopeptidase [Tsuneonella dongtanensis]ANY20459.1 Methicillin resistance mecR1 protein [Tsuneonella dongtanensis]